MPEQRHNGDWELDLWLAWESFADRTLANWERVQLNNHRWRRALRHSGGLWERMEKHATVHRHKQYLAHAPCQAWAMPDYLDLYRQWWRLGQAMMNKGD